MADSHADTDVTNNHQSDTEDKPVEIAELFNDGPAVKTSSARPPPTTRGDSRQSGSGSGSPGKKEKNKKGKEQSNLFKAQMKVNQLQTELGRKMRELHEVQKRNAELSELLETEKPNVKLSYFQTLKDLRVQLKTLQTETEQARRRADELSRRAEAAEWTAQTAAKLREEAEKEREQAVQERDTLFKILQNYRGQNGVLDLKIKRMSERTCDRTVQTYVRSCMSCIREGNVAAVLQGNGRCPHSGNIGVSQANLSTGSSVLQPCRQPSWVNGSAQGHSQPATTPYSSPGINTQNAERVPFESRATVQARTAERLTWGRDWARVGRPMPQTGNMRDAGSHKVIFRRPQSGASSHPATPGLK